MSKDIGYKSAQAYNEKLQKLTKDFNNMVKLLAEGGVVVRLDLAEDTKSSTAKTKFQQLKVELSVPVRAGQNVN